MASTDNQLKVLTLKNIKPTQHGEVLRDGGSLSGKVNVKRDGSVSVSFSFQFRVGNKRREKHCGTWPKTDLSCIRKKRDELRLASSQGIDPIEAERNKRQALVAAKLQAEDERQREEIEIAQQAARMTFANLFERWAKIQLAERKDGGAEIRRAFEKDVLPLLGSLYADEITRQLIAKVLNDIVERGAKRMANRTLSDLRQCFGFAIGSGLLENDPTSHLKKTAFGGKETERDRILDETELCVLLVSALPLCNLSLKAKAAIHVLLGTAARVGELLRAKRHHFDLTNRTWQIPADNAKNGVPHTIYLSDFSLSSIKKLLSIIDNPIWLFPNRSGETHVCVKTLTKQITDRQSTSPMFGRSKDTQSLMMLGGKWTPHDLRRSAATLMGELGVMPHIIELCLNHKEENKVKRTYQRQRYEEEQRNAFIVLGNYFSSIVQGPSSKLASATQTHDKSMV